VKRFMRRIILSLAALSPGVAFLTVQEMAMSLAVMLVGLTGAISVAVAVFAVSPKINETLSSFDTADTEYPSLLTQAALRSLQENGLDPLSLRAHLHELITPTIGKGGFVTLDDQIAMILAQIMAQWSVTEAMHLNDDQVRELWLIERMLRATPAQAGALADNFIAPNAMLAMRDRVASSASV